MKDREVFGSSMSWAYNQSTIGVWKAASAPLGRVRAQPRPKMDLGHSDLEIIWPWCYIQLIWKK